MSSNRDSVISFLSKGAKTSKKETNSPVLESIKTVSPVRRRDDDELNRIIGDVKNDITEFEEIKKDVEIEKTPPPPKKLFWEDKPILTEQNLKEHAITLINTTDCPDYSKESNEVLQLCYNEFEKKFETLSIYYPDENITFPDNISIDKIHKRYHNHLKQLFIKVNLPQYQMIAVIAFFVLEIIAVKFLNLPLSGFAKMEIKKLYKYHSMIIEIGGLVYSTGGEDNTPVHWKLVKTLGMSIGLFIVLKIVMSYFSEDEKVLETIKNILEKLMEDPISPNEIENGKAEQLKEERSATGGLGEMFGGLDLTGLLSNLVTGFTSRAENGNQQPVKKRRVINHDI